MKRFKVIIASFVWCILFGSVPGLSLDLDIQELRSVIEAGTTEEQHVVEAKMQNKNFLKNIFKRRTVPIKKMYKKDRVQAFRAKKREDFLQKWNDFLYEKEKNSPIGLKYNANTLEYKKNIPFMNFYINELRSQNPDDNRIIDVSIFFAQILYVASYIYSIDSFMALTHTEKEYVNSSVEAALSALTRYLGESDSLVGLVNNYLTDLKAFSDDVNQEKIKNFKKTQDTLVTSISERLKNLEPTEESGSEQSAIVLKKDFLNILFYYCIFLFKKLQPHLQEIVLQKDNSDELLLQALKEDKLIPEQKEIKSMSAEDFLDMVLVAPEYIVLIKNIQLCLSALSKGAIIAAQDAIDKKVVIGGVQELSLNEMIDVLKHDSTAPADYLDLIKKLVTILTSKPLELLTFKDLQKMQHLIAKKIEEDPLRPEWKSFADKRKLFLYSYVAFLNANILPLIQKNLKKRDTAPSLYKRFLQFWKNKKEFEG